MFMTQAVTFVSRMLSFILKASLVSCAHFPHLGSCGFSRQLSNDEKVRIMLLREVLRLIASREISCRDRDVSHEAWWVRRGRATLRVFYHTVRHVWMPADGIDYYKHDNRA